MNFSNLTIQDIQLESNLEVNPATGGVSVAVSIPSSEGRNGFGPQLSLGYQSSARNSPFGLGWNLGGLPFLAIDTRDGLPNYDGTDSYAFQGTDALVPQLIKSGTSWTQRILENADYWIYFYRPKKETAFTRFEKWVKKSNSTIHWRTRSKDNVLSVFGLDPAGKTKIYDPENEAKIFVWLIEAQYDENGNAIQYQYKSENAENIDPTLPYESNRIKNATQKGFSQKYPDRILYGNSQPMVPDGPVPAANKWLFETVFDYGEYPNRPFIESIPPANSTWKLRPDPFSVYNAGFERRTYRLCRRILIYHHFDELATPTSLTGIFECRYQENEAGTTLNALSYTGVRRDLTTGSYSEKKLPELTFAYTQPAVEKSFKSVVQETNENFPQGFNHVQTRLVDLFGEGLPGILTETARTWYYKHNLGNGVFGRQQVVIEKPTAELGAYSLGDFDQDGNLNLFTMQGRMAGYYEYDREREKWSGFQPFQNIPQVGPAKFLDLDADGLSDLVVECEDKIVCYPFKGKEGFDKPYEFAKPVSNGVAYAPTLGGDLMLDYFQADMTGDGLTDQVRIQNGRVAYYPNLGNGHFGEAVLMENAPVIDFDTKFDASRIRLYDLDGSGTTDIVYLGNGEIRFWHNASGNKFTEGGRITNLPYIDNISSAIVLDFLGQGTPCLVWSNSLANFQGSSLQYLELTNGVKPRLLASFENGMGKEVTVAYGYSASHYLAATREGHPWHSKIPSHFPVADQKSVTDHIANSRFITQYKYRDGQYDGNERTFVTFGLIEQFDTELFENASLTHDTDYAQPACTRTWLHNGLFGWDKSRQRQFYGGDPRHQVLVAQRFEQNDALELADFEAGYRALAGRVIRQEIYATDAEGTLAEHPFLVTQNAYAIRKLQPITPTDDSCFFAYPAETVSTSYEQQADDPKVSHHLSVVVGQYGDIERNLSISYARRNGTPGILPSQSRDYLLASQLSYQHSDSLDTYQISTLFESRRFEINHLAHNPDEYLKPREVQSVFDAWVTNALAFDQPLSAGGSSTARLTSWERTYFWNDAFDAALPLGQTGTLRFAHHEESACFNDAVIATAFGGKVTSAMLSATAEGDYVQKDGYWWQRAAVNHFLGAVGFYNLDRVERTAGNVTSYKYDPHFINVVEITDPLGNVDRGEIDYNLVEPFRLIDPNGNVSEVLYDPLGVAIATCHQGTVLDENNAVQKYGNGLLADYTRRNDEDFDRILANPDLYIQGADSFLFYDFENWQLNREPLRSLSLSRENLVHDGKGNVDNSVKAQIGIDYQDGFGRPMQSKRKVEPGLAVVRQANGSLSTDAAGEPILTQINDRWLVTGHIVYNNKQQPVRQFEPFFSAEYVFESDQALETYGVATQTYYDAVGREVRTDFPNSTFSEVVLSPWEIQSFDPNDTVDRSLYKTFREILPTTTPERMALDRSLAHKDTPTIVRLDPMGQEIEVVETNNDGTVRRTENHFDSNGNLVKITDARNLTAFEYQRDMLGRLLHEKSMDAGAHWSFYNNLDQAIHLWDSRNIHQRTHYDSLDRVVTVHVDGALGLDQITERFIYGEDASVAQAKEKNLRRQLVKHFDQAGTQELLKATPGGLPLTMERKLLDQFTTEPDWTNPAAVALAADTYRTEYTHDAFGRTVRQVLPDGTTRKYLFNQGGGMESLQVSTQDGGMTDVELLKGTSFDAKGLLQTAQLGNGVRMDYTYDPETFRLQRLLSRKTTGSARTYQDIRYTYDPVGNLIHLVDEAQQPTAPNPHVLQGLNVSAHSEFTYDALYQLKTAQGRVHQALLMHDYADRSREAGLAANWGKGTRHITLNNGAAVERYTRTYDYDESGNIKSIRHSGTSQNWTKQLWTSATSNRSLPKNDLNDVAVANPESRFDASGNCVHLPHLRSLEWNYRNNISKAVIIDRSAQGKPNDEEYYVYGGDGIRVRKITQRLVDVANNIIERTEKVYLDSCEIKRITRGNTEILKRKTSQISDGTNNIALIHQWESDTQARETGDITQKKLHYQLGNHLGSTSLELDEAGDVITYEEYFPYGGTSFLAGRNTRDIDLKEYRYCSKERDDFTGLYYFGYRYYAHWIGGWVSPDPLGPEDAVNLYLYVQNNPINLVDPNGLQSTEGGVSVTQAPLPREQWEALTQSQRDAIQRGDFVTGTGEILTRAEVDQRISDGQRFNLHSITSISDPRQDPRWEEWREAGMSEEEADSMVELFQSLDEALSSINSTLPSGDEDSQTGGGASETTATGPSGETADSSGTGRTDDTSSGGVNDGTGTDGSQTQTNSGGGGGNTGTGINGNGTVDNGPGAGQQGSGTGNGGNGTTNTGRGANGNGSGTGTTSNTGNGTGSTQGNGQVGGQVGGVPNGRVGGQVGGSPDGQSGGDPAGGPNGSLEGDINGIPDGIPNGTLTGGPGSTGQGAGDQAGTGDRTQGTHPNEVPPNPDQPQTEEGQQGDPRTNFMDDIVKVAGYLNLEFGDDAGGEAGGVPGGMNLFNLKLPMWAKRALQVAYVAVTVITTLIPIGKAALAAKVAIQGALKVGLKATAAKMLTAVAARIPTRAAIGAAVTRARGAIGTGLSRVGGLFKGASSNLRQRVSSLADKLRGGRSQFFTVQDAADATRLRGSGLPWPNLPNRAHLGDGVYSWGNLDDALGYQQRLAKGGTVTEVVPFSVLNRDLNKFKSLSIDSLPDPESWMSKNSLLWGGTPNHGLDYITRGTAIGVEHFFSSSVFQKLKF